MEETDEEINKRLRNRVEKLKLAMGTDLFDKTNIGRLAKTLEETGLGLDIEKYNKAKDTIPIYYKLEGKKVIVTQDFSHGRHRRPGLFVDKLFKGKVRIVTSFLSIDHGPISNKEDIEDYKPLVFETMIFDDSDDTKVGFSEYGDIDGYQKRYHSYEEAYMGHRTAVRAVRKRYEK